MFEIVLYLFSDVWYVRQLTVDGHCIEKMCKKVAFRVAIVKIICFF